MSSCFGTNTGQRQGCGMSLLKLSINTDGVLERCVGERKKEELVKVKESGL